MHIVPGMQVATARIQETRVNHAHPPDMSRAWLCALVHWCIRAFLHYKHQ